MTEEEADGFPSREELLAGLPARRAGALVFLIETRTAALTARSRRAMERFLSEEAAKERDLVFMEAFSLGAEPPVRPTVQDLERYAPHWASLVGSAPTVRAAVARRLGQRYSLVAEAVPGIRAALGLDDAAVRQAYHRLFGEPLDRIYTARPPLWDRARWTWARLARRVETLSPFWTSYSLTLTETVSASILALPIAVVAVGPLAGLVILAVLGLVNTVTVAYLAEAVARSGTMRFGSAYLGRLVGDLLGGAGSAILSVSLFVLVFLGLPAYYLGVSTHLADALGAPAPAWVAVLFVVGLFYLRRESLNATIASALIVGAVNIGLVIALCALALAHLRLDHLLRVNVPFLGGRPFEPAILGLVFGVTLAANFGHTSVSLCGRLVLQRDTTGRALLRGCAAAQLTALLLNGAFIVAVNGAVAPESLAGEKGTALGPLQGVVGPAVLVLGTVFVVLGMGMGSIHVSLALSSLIRERLPAVYRPAVLLLRRRAALRCRAGRRLRDAEIRIVYLGIEGNLPRFRLDAMVGDEQYRTEVSPPDRWEILGTNGWSPLLDRLPGLRRRGLHLAVETLEADDWAVRIRVTSSLRIDIDEPAEAEGLTLASLLELPDAEAELLASAVRAGVVRPDAATELALGRDGGAAEALESLAERGLVGDAGDGREEVFRPRWGARRRRQLPLRVWEALGQLGEPPPKPRRQGERVRRAVFGPRGRFILAASPVAAGFLLAEAMLLSGTGSFAGLIGFIGVVVMSLLAGIFPVLLVAASRRKGEHVPRATAGFLGHPALLTVIYILFLAAILVHGLLIWSDALRRVVALLVAAVVVVMTAVLTRRRGFARRMTIEVREELDDGGRALFSVTAGGRPVPADILLSYPAQEVDLRATSARIPSFRELQEIRVRVKPLPPIRELKVFVHRVTPDGGSQAVPATVEVREDGQVSRTADIKAGQSLIVPVRGREELLVDVRLAKSPRAGHGGSVAPTGEAPAPESAG